MESLVFYASGLLSVVSAGLVVTRRNPVYSTIWLVLFFLSISLDFLILRAPFLAVIQVLVYAGAIMVLFLFVIMLLNLTPEELREDVPRSRKVLSAALALAVYFLITGAVARSPTVRSLTVDLAAPVADPVSADAGETSAMGEALFGTHALAFEYASILLLVAIIGAIYLTKRRRPAAQAAAGASGAEASPRSATLVAAGAPNKEGHA